jgi:hypothetical protein
MTPEVLVRLFTGAPKQNHDSQSMTAHVGTIGGCMRMAAETAMWKFEAVHPICCIKFSCQQ